MRRGIPRWAKGSTGWPEFHLTEPVRAIQVNGPEDLPDLDQVHEQTTPTGAGDWYFVGLEGTFAAAWGDYLVAGPDGGFCPVHQAHFETLYEMGRGERSLDNLSPAIFAWCERHEIPRDPHAQLLKVVEEIGELTQAVLKGNDEGLVDELGDVYVTLVATARALEDRTGGADLADCALAAYDRIKDRSGEVRNGVLVKASDLEGDR